MKGDCHSATWQGYHPPSAPPCPPLPDTGFDIGLIVVIAVLILALGMVLRFGAWRR